MNNTTIIPVNEVYLKRIIKVNVNGYGEIRNKRTVVYLNETIRSKVEIKCKKTRCTITEAVNQILYKWSKHERENNNDVEDNQMSLDSVDANNNGNYFDKIIEIDRIPENRFDIALEKTIHKKTMAKCNRIKCSYIQTVNQLLNIWTSDISDIQEE